MNHLGGIIVLACRQLFSCCNVLDSEIQVIREGCSLALERHLPSKLKTDMSGSLCDDQ